MTQSLHEFLQEEIQRLRSKLEQKRGKSRGTTPNPRGDDYFTEQKRAIEADREKILRDSGLIQEERTKLISELEEQSRMLEKERREQAEVAERIRKIESGLLGGMAETELADHTRRQQSELENKRIELAEQKVRFLWERVWKANLETRTRDAPAIGETRRGRR